MKHPVEFQPMGRRGEAEEGKDLLGVATQLGVNIRTDCGGKGTCGKCRVVVSSANGLPPPTSVERKILKDKIESNYRLACQIPVMGPIQLLVPEESRVEETVILTEGKGVPFKLESMVAKYHVVMSPPSLSDAASDDQRLLEALHTLYGQKANAVALPALQKLPTALRSGGWDITITIRHGAEAEVIDVEPGYDEDVHGIAVDIGTTTVVAYLVNLSTGEVKAIESTTNPQVAYGDDVMARISHTMEEKDGPRRMRHSIVNGLNQLIGKACTRSGLAPEQVADMCVVGNTAMHHLFLGIEAQFLAKSPFPPAVNSPCDFRARDLGLRINPAANVHLLPNVAGFVGADCVADVIATEIYNQKELTLLIDIGTNGELVLGNQSLGLAACSAAAGPAFEGAHIQYGMRAASGAIEHVHIDPATYEVTCQVIGGAPARGICGSGIIDAIAEMLRTGIISASGRMNTEIACPRIRKGQRGSEFVLEWADRTAVGEDIVMTQADVREVQLAKGAFYAGTKMLMKSLGVERVDRVLLAGAFGSYLDPKAAMSIGLFPPCEIENVVALGNTAGYGARMALLSASKRAEAAAIAAKMRYVELTVCPDFQGAFVAGTKFPAATG